MAHPDDLNEGTRVMAPVGRTMHRAVVVAVPAEHGQAAPVFGLRLEEPLERAGMDEAVSYLECEASRLDLGWVEP